MDKNEIDRLAVGYVTQYLTHGDTTSGAWDHLETLVMRDPACAWLVIERVFELSFPSIYLAWIGAGPLEELLHYHPMMFVPRVVERARADARFREALQFARVDRDIAAILEKELYLRSGDD